jgi:YD repeat-containing protein
MMKRYTLLLLLFSGCAEKVSPERADDPKYLLVEEIRTQGWFNPVTTSTRYIYDDEDIVKEVHSQDGKTIYKSMPENRGVENTAAVEETMPSGAIRLYFTDATGKVLRIKGADEEHWYRYDEQNRLVERAIHFSSRKDTLRIEYNFLVTAEGLPVDRYGEVSSMRPNPWFYRVKYEFYTYSLSEKRMERPLLPFHFGKVREMELVRFDNTSFVEHSWPDFSYTLVKDAAGRVIEKHGMVGYRFTEVIKYIYAAK